MSDDIVTRLREEAANRRGHWDTLTEAADEIERLRAGLRLMANAYAGDVGSDRGEWKWDIDEMCAEFVRKAAQGIKAVRGES